ncbi:FAD-dependent oxidoreductase [Subdoligranulum variabile]|uniref:Pyridine nucleotide-disulfide oxidoreductase n=1 Tax=Subdoligranulum variabile DSM 15176 TaxID=411471 RepID=D1PIA7_9FIRM|nr:FAD-dependent oxidoreductase [Subdoligranulum variabile]EFB77575.1 pyridine nucleotide-disulfide oxidoreductase [Subdoligranulum variabile DSM 15176]UWP67177.1 FAD-dependent oxidoreductase [Subdoligranulum variabile]
MNQAYQSLFTPWKIRDVEIKNRIVLCPMGGTSLFGWMEPNHFDTEAARFFLERARNNVGLIIPGIAPIRDTIGGRWLYQNKKMFRQLKPYMEQIHATGAKLFVQLTAGMGRSWGISDQVLPLHKNPVLRTLAKPILDTDYQLASPSPLPARWAEDVTCPEMTVPQIEEIIEAFAKTALLCKEAGVDGVEVHAVHEGYLLDQFAMKYTNHRTDAYGGSFENRYRFAVEIVKAIKAVCGQDYPVSIRYSVISKVKDFCYGALPGETDYTEIGRDMEESEKAAKYLQDAGYDMLDADNGTYDSWYWSHPPMYMPQNCNLDDVAYIKGCVDIPVVCAGRMEPDVAAEAIAAGRIDAMGVARQFLADGEWVTKLLEDRTDDIRPCICCHNGCFNLSHYKGHANAQSFPDTRGMARCAINPPTMQSQKYKITPAEHKKNIAVIGGGIGGMESALVCAQRGHTVTIYEKSGALGGVFVAAAAPSFKEKDRALLTWYARALSQNPRITVKLHTEVTDLAALGADEVIVATGASAISLRVPGADKGIQAVDYLLGKAPVGEKVVIVGGGLTGCEIAYDLYLQGKQPAIVEMKDDLIASPTVCLANASFLRDFFKTNQVPVYLETSLKEIRDGSVTVTAKDGTTKELPADSVILSVGYRPAPLAPKGGHIHLVGDANKVGNLRTVIWRAWDVCMKL